MSDEEYPRDLLGDPIIPKAPRRNTRRRHEPAPEPPPARWAKSSKVPIHLPKLKAFVWLIVAAIAFIAWHAYQYQFKGVVPGAEADKMPPAVYGAIVAVLCVIFFGWFVVECSLAIARHFQGETARAPWHRTKHRWIAPAAHVALAIVVIVFMWIGSFALPYGVRDTSQFIADAQDTFSKPPGDRTQVAEAALEAPALDKNPLAVPDNTSLLRSSKELPPSAPIITGALPSSRKRKAAAPQPVSHYPLDPFLAKICDLFEGLLVAAGAAEKR